MLSQQLNNFKLYLNYFRLFNNSFYEKENRYFLMYIFIFIIYLSIYLFLCVLTIHILFYIYENYNINLQLDIKKKSNILNKINHNNIFKNNFSPINKKNNFVKNLKKLDVNIESKNEIIENDDSNTISYFNIDDIKDECNDEDDIMNRSQILNKSDLLPSPIIENDKHSRELDKKLLKKILSSNNINYSDSE